MASEAEVAALIFDVVPGVMRVLRRLMRDSAGTEISIPQWRVLAQVYRGASRAADLAERQGVSLAAISKMLDALESRGLVERAYKEGNRKQLFLRLSPRGMALYRKTRKTAERVISGELKQANFKNRAAMKHGLLSLQALFSSEKNPHS